MYSEKEIIRKVESLAEKIGKLEVVQDYHNVEKQIHNNQAIKQKMNRLKTQQKQSVNFQNYGKQNALEQSEAKIQYLKDEINELPIVEEFRSAQYEANDLLQMMVKTMEDRLNEYNKKEHNEYLF
ncbi:YlbF/YmcA family competence regulator [Staphylococcus epidermidis]|uniref:RicAFT regulatory complex protein RicA family protein n=2 Tax=Staphylococcus epidermidis TaxID=1282 RepID=UPI002DBDDB91|nr:YlbF family regulator [Staphylococcus epidermidis]MEB7398729.1 YlbF family regulator [Staphylococcus epidermidis]